MLTMQVESSVLSPVRLSILSLGFARKLTITLHRSCAPGRNVNRYQSWPDRSYKQPAGGTHVTKQCLGVLFKSEGNIAQSQHSELHFLGTLPMNEPPTALQEESCYTRCILQASGQDTWAQQWLLRLVIGPLLSRVPLPLAISQNTTFLIDKTNV